MVEELIKFELKGLLVLGEADEVLPGGGGELLEEGAQAIAEVVVVGVGGVLAECELVGGGITEEVVFGLGEQGPADGGVRHWSEAAPAGATEEVDSDGFKKVVLMMSGIKGGMVLAGGRLEKKIAGLASLIFRGTGAEVVLGGEEGLMISSGEIGDEALIVIGAGSGTVVEMGNENGGVVLILVKEDNGIEAAGDGEEFIGGFSHLCIV